MSRSIFFSVGEPSGDQHAARLIKALHHIDETLEFRGFGGSEMRASGCEIEVELTQHAVMGFLEVLPKIRQFLKFAKQAECVFKAGQVQAVVLVDFPGFNWHIAKAAKKHGVPVFYYCPPQLWAWAGWRIRKMRRYVDHVLAVLPIEERYFGDRGISTTYVGHPFFDAVYEMKLDGDLLGVFEKDQESGKIPIGVLPGSRDHEVQRTWPILLEAIRRLHLRNPHARFLVAAYRESHALLCKQMLNKEDRILPIDFFVGKTSEIIQASQCAMMVSGSVSLELMARQTPAVVTYRVGRLFYSIAKRLVNLESFTLPNLMSDQKVYPEMVSVGNPETTIEFLTQSIHMLLNDQQYSREVREQLRDLACRFAEPGASSKAAQAIIDQLESVNSSADTKDVKEIDAA